MKIIKRAITETFLIAFAAAHTSAKKTGRITYVVEDAGNLVVSDKYPDEPRIMLAKCWPGGRKELKFIVDPPYPGLSV